MDLNNDFANLSLDTFERANNASESYSFVGLTVDSRITDILTGTENEGTARTAESTEASGEGVSIERFFEECFDTGIAVFAESGFGQKTFIGAGATMEVYKSQWEERKQMVALKYFKTPVWSRLVKAKSRSDDHKRLLEACMLELRVLTDEFIKHHENIATLLGVSWHASGDNNICPILIMELACEEHPTLKEFLALDTPVQTRLELVRDVLEGLSALHQIDVVHGDVKPENILIFMSSMSATGMSARLSDFGFCRPTADYKYGAGGTPYWNAPECLPNAPSDLRKEEYGKRRDLYSLGLLAFHAITRQMPFGSTRAEEISALKLGDRVSNLLEKKLRSLEPVMASVSPALTPTKGPKKLGRLMDSLKKRTSGVASSSRSDSSFKPEVPVDIVESITRVVALQPAARPSVDAIRGSLTPFTSARAVAIRAGREASLVQDSNHITLVSNVLLTRYGQRSQAIGDLGGRRNLDATLPRGLKAALYQSLVRVTQTGSRSEKAAAMNRLGIFFLNGFGTAKSFRQAFSWFCRAAEHGSVEARKMVFRMERAASTLPERVEADLTDAVRAIWMIDAIIDTAETHVDESMVPDGRDPLSTRAKIRGVLASLDPVTVRYGLVRDIEHSVVRIMAYRSKQGQTSAKLHEQLEAAARSSPALLAAFKYTYSDMPEALHQVLSANPVPLAFLNRLVTMATDFGLRSALRTLCVKHGANPNYIDTLSGRTAPPLLTAAMSNDIPTVTALLDCGANAVQLIAAFPETINHGGSHIITLTLQLIERQAGREFLDGVTPAMNSAAWAEREAPPDNLNPPPLFHGVVFNRLDKIFALLVRGADPNVRCEGWTAAHLAVRMLHPSALLFLLALGADPNARNPKEGYTTPLHTLSEARLKLPQEFPGYNITPVDFLIRPYQPLEVRTGDLELVQRQALVVRILLKCGADPSARCIDGFTPLMTSIVTTAPDAASLTTVMLDAGVTVEDRSSRGETVLHVCVMASDPARLTAFFEHGAKSLIDATDLSNCTPLILACMMPEGSADVVKVLVENGADLTMRGPFGLTALDVALLAGNNMILDHLLARVANLSGPLREALFHGTDEDLRSPFHFCLAAVDVVAAQERFNALRILMAPATARKLASHRDKNGYTPYHVALCLTNITACRILITDYGATDGIPPAGGEGTAIPNIQDIRSRREKLMKERDSSEPETMLDECEYTGGKRSLTPAEIRHQSELNQTIQTQGESSQRVIWCMDTLGTVHERYGRLRTAQDVYHRGWVKALEVLGPDNRITHDLACKLLRVMRSRGVDDTEVPYVANWHAVHGSNTIRTGFVVDTVANMAPDLGTTRGYDDNYSHGHQPGVKKEAVLCVRDECKKPSTMLCSGCKHIPYCSEACRVQDMVDPEVQHHLGCVLADPIAMSPAIRVQDQDIYHPAARKEAQRVWDRALPAMQNPGPNRLPPPPRTAPEIKYVRMGFATPAYFTKPIALVIPKNSAVTFLNTDLYEVRHFRRENRPWSRGGMVIATMEMEVLIRPVEEAVRAEVGKSKGREPEGQDVLIWMEIMLDWDFQRYLFPK